MIGESVAFRGVVELIEKLARYDAPVLIEGETGTGKELAARAIHYRSERADRPFVPMNCGAIPDALFENELFGHRRGAFTDARDDQVGLVALADRGTLFLDEVDSLSHKGQVSLLRFLQDQQYRPLGANEERSANVRLVAACNRSLDDLVKDGRFRSDLFYRLKIMQLGMPALRERKGDAALLAEHFVRVGSARFGKPVMPFHPETLGWLDRYAWPGNVRELENFVYRTFLLSDGPCIEAPPPDRAIAEPDEQLSYRQAKSRAIAAFEREFLTALMRRAEGSVTAAARLVRTDRRHLGRLLERYGVAKRTDLA